MHAEAKHVDGRLQQFRIDPLPEQGGSRVRLDQAPQPIDHERRVRLVGIEKAPKRLAQRPHELLVVGTLLVGRCEAPASSRRLRSPIGKSSS